MSNSHKAEIPATIRVKIDKPALVSMTITEEKMNIAPIL
jgi:hypothetical protein